MWDIVGFYLNPPDTAVVLSVDEKSPDPGARPDAADSSAAARIAGNQTHDYEWHGTTTLFAAPNVLEGATIAECWPKQRHQELLHFLTGSTSPLRRNSRSPRYQLHSYKAFLDSDEHFAAFDVAITGYSAQFDSTEAIYRKQAESSIPDGHGGRFNQFGGNITEPMKRYRRLAPL